MTVASQITDQPYTANGSSTQFSFPNKIFAGADLVVVLTDLVGNLYFFVGGPTTFTNSATGLSYTVSNIDVDTGALVTFSAPPTNGWKVDIRSATPEIQSTSVKNQGQFLPELHEEAFDRATRMIQDLLRLTYTYGIHSQDVETTPWPALPLPALRKGLVLIFDPVTGLPTVGIPTTQTLTQALIGQLLYPQISAENTFPPTNLAYYYGDARRYGTITGSAGADTAILQAAINQSMQPGGYPWVVPFGVTMSVKTSGSIVTPVGDACTITAPCTGVVDGTILGFNNCNIINCTANNVTITGRGLIKAYGTYFATGAGNGSNFKNSGSHVTFAVNVASPAQYGVYYVSTTAVGGRIGPLDITGGIGSYVNNQNYGIEVEGPFNGMTITGINVYPDGIGGVVVQGVASGFNGGIPTSVTVSNLNINACWDHSLYFYCTDSAVSNVTATGCGAGIRVPGQNNTLSNFECNNSIGGIDLEDSAGTTLTGFQINGCHGIALSVEILNNLVDGVMSDQSITNGVITFSTGDTAARCGVRVLCDFSGTNTNQWNIGLSNIQVINATQSVTNEGAIRLEVPAGKILSRVKVSNCIIDSSGYAGIEVAGGGTLLDSNIDNNTVRNPGTNAAAGGSSTSAINIASTTTMQYGSVNFNKAIDDRGGGAKMANAYTVLGTEVLVAFRGNEARGYITGFGSFLQAGDYVAGTTTPSVQNRDGLDIANSGATVITNFLNAQEGQVIFLTFEDANTTITRANAVLAGGVNFVSAASHTLTLMKRGSQWWEMCRSSNS